MTSTAALEFTYDEVDVPAVKHTGGKDREPNPHADAVARLHGLVVKENAVKALRIAIPVQDDEKATQAAVSKHVRFLRTLGDAGLPTVDGGEPVPFTVKTDVTDGVRNIGTTKSPKEIAVKEIRFWIYTAQNGDKVVPARITRSKAAPTA
jgi:hypothetical protein